MKRLRKSYFLKCISVFLALNLLTELFFPIAAFALTGGPSQPEVQSFSPIGTSDMVNVSTGDFNYNIPLLDVGGYPINLIYNAGGTMDEEASWVGYGWNINPGVINRGKRGLPDDFNGDNITKELNILENKTTGVTLGVGVELFGVEGKGSTAKETGPGLSLGVNMGITFNNYTGVGVNLGTNVGVSAGGFRLGLALDASGEDGTTITPSIGFTSGLIGDSKSTNHFGATVGLPMNSRAGVQQLTITPSYSRSVETSQKTVGKNTYGSNGGTSFGGSGGGVITFGHPSYTPSYQMAFQTTAMNFHSSIGGDVTGLNPHASISGFHSENKLVDNVTNKPSFGFLYSHISATDANAVHDFNREKDGIYTPEVPNLPLSSQTYDLFNASGQGIGGQYRFYRKDLGMVYDATVENGTGGTGSSGVEIGLGNLVKNGNEVSAT